MICGVCKQGIVGNGHPMGVVGILCDDCYIEWKRRRWPTLFEARPQGKNSPLFPPILEKDACDMCQSRRREDGKGRYCSKCFSKITWMREMELSTGKIFPLVERWHGRYVARSQEEARAKERDDEMNQVRAQIKLLQEKLDAMAV